ncbi:Nuclear export receptor CSE1/CAS (importin beta superfamily) [Handroanthus impetiginosus]|uniref:Nuclear export receptor CSE1/CAS (Importin beta superfamily) n=1 Tax=Handroanthus impetiginosus TaxID=429701 RepID=A0A2G9HIH0_9LAMI|nr:Nuclear export receptor CSE1/CAS (importin beta superfamily) [Handroanthus impetiginosus]
MEWNPETLQFLPQCFLNTLSLLPEPRRRAEAALSEAADRPNYGLAVLHLVAEPSVDEQIRQSAAVNFKNHLKAHWAPQPKDPAQIVVPDAEKEQIKSLIVTLMVNSSTKIQAQLSEALTIIGKHDFPKAWPTLLPELVVTLDKLSQANDYVSVNGVLATINSSFKKFRYQFKTNELLRDLKYCLDSFAKPLLEVFKRTAGFIDQGLGSGTANASVVKGYMESQRLCCRIFYSLNFMELPEFFEDHMDEWMIEFKKYLTMKYSPLEDSGTDGLALVDELRAAVCENISLYMEKEEDTFQKYLGGFVDAVWGLLVIGSSSSSRVRLTVTAVKFLTTVSTSVHHTLFARDDILQQVCNSIVIPNFIRRDMEGSDFDTRRRIACELLKGIALNYKEKITEKVSAQVQSLLASFAENPAANWKHKDCAIYLVVSLATKKAGGSSISTDLVDVESFFGSVIVPELRNQDVDGFPMLKAGVLKFFTMFRNQISKPVALALLPDVVRFLGLYSNVVHSYAASCIEKLLLVKDEGGRARYSAADVSPILLPLMTNLFSALHKPESAENQYVMKCIMRVLGVANVSQEVALPCVNGLATILNRVCENPKNPIFNHYMFESVALLIRRACEHEPSLISAFETSLLPVLQMILSRDVSEFCPYAFQLLAQLVDLNRSPLPGNYMDIFAILLLPESWKKSANVPALVRLLQAFLRKAPHELNQQRRLSSVLGIFNTLVSSPSTDEQGFYVVNTVIENLGYDAFSPYISHIWVALFERLQYNRTVKFVKSLVIFISLFLVKHGSQNLASTMNAVQPDVLSTILEQFCIPNLRLITGSMVLKLTSVTSTRLICESLSPSDIVTLLPRPEEDRVEEDPEVPDFGESVGYSATFVRLYNAGRNEEDPLREINDPKQFLVASLVNLSARSPGILPRIINENLEPANQAALLQLCSFYNLAIV